MFLRGSSRRPDLRDLLGDISGILALHDMEVVAVRGKSCEVLFANSGAQSHLYTEQGFSHECRTGYARHFPGLCDHCPHGGAGKDAEPEPFTIVDIDGRTHSGRRSIMNWVDGKPVAVFVMRDITPEIEAKERLYALAYMDHLTRVPNRQKLKDDFGALEGRIAKNELAGIVALFDLDFFKAINDTYGHNTGDIVLRRLTEYLQGERAFSGHLYRLGGDEFVLLYADAPDRFGSEEEMVGHYSGLLSLALRSYTLPNIDLECTLSMGVSLFPQHGTNLSEVLRKADIALYQAKEAGRNRVEFFSSQYDTAQKFKDMYVAIQPVLLRDGRTFGYELVDRGSGGADDDKTVTLSEFNRTMDALGLNDIENQMHYFIMYSKQMLSPAVLKNLPKEKFIVQMSLPAEATPGELEGAAQACLELKRNGYRLAVAGLGSASGLQEFLGLADYCKLSVSDRDALGRREFVELSRDVRFIAAGVDTAEDFRLASESGFSLFQGYYFNQPAAPQRTKVISPLKVNYFRLLKLSVTEDYMDFREISSVISSDVAMSYKLLRILNSAAVGLRNISSVATAVAYMGEESLKKWIAVLALRGIAEDKPLELVRLSLIRARFGELLAPFFRMRRDPQQVFMVGMLSLIHIALDMPREQVLEEIPVSDGIRQSLLTKTGVYSELLRFFENYEYANWDAVSQFAEEHSMSAIDVNNAYISSVKWYNDLAK